MVLPESDQIHLLITLKNSEQMNEHFQHENSEKKTKAQDCGSVLQLGEVKCWERDLTIFTLLTVLPPGQGQFMELCTGSVQFSRSVVSDSLRPHESKHAGLPVPH